MSSLTNVSLGYNSIGDILAVSGMTEHGSELQLWMRGNYHWYCKIHRVYPEPIRSAQRRAAWALFWGAWA